MLPLLLLVTTLCRRNEGKNANGSFGGAEKEREEGDLYAEIRTLESFRQKQVRWGGAEEASFSPSLFSSPTQATQPSSTVY